MPALHDPALLGLNPALEVVLPHHSRLRAAAKLLVAAVIIAALVRKIGAPEIWSSISGIRPAYLLLAALLLLLDAMTRSFNWKQLLASRDLHAPFPTVLHGYLYGGVIGAFIPSSLGTDVARAAVVARRTRSGITEIGSSIVLLNLMGLWALCLTVFTISLWRTVEQATLSVLPWALAVSAAGIAGLLTSLLIAPVVGSLQTRGPKLVQVVMGLLQTIASYAEHKGVLAFVSVVALGSLALQIILVFVLAQALQVPVSLQDLALLLPIVLLSRLIPLSISGFGAEQGVFVFVLGLVGVPASDAFALSLSTSATALGFLGLCGIAYLLIGGANGFRSLSTAPGDDPALVSTLAAGDKPAT